MDTLKIVALLAPNARPAHRAIVAWLARAAEIPMALVESGTWQEQLALLDRGEVDGAFICGLPYTLRADQLEPIAAPAHTAPVYAGRAVYWSDVIVRRDSQAQSFAALRGARWAYNEPGSFSGFLVALAHLAALGTPSGFFGQAVESGSHLASLALVQEGRADAAAIDSTVLELAQRDDPSLAGRVRSVARLGPNPAPPLVLARRLAPALKGRIGAAITAMHTHTEGKAALARGLIQRFLPATDADYTPIRHLARRAEGARFT